MSDFIPVSEPVLSKESKKLVNEALKTGWISSSGKYVDELERKFSKYIGVKHAVAVSSGTAALHVALLSLGIKKGDEVIVPAFTMASTWMAVLYVGAKPVFIDCDPGTFNINPDLIEEKITKKTKAIIPVHIYGHSADMDPITRIARKHKLKVIEDAAEAHGAEYKGKKCGSMGDVSCFSFYANKIVTTGEGGMLLTNNKKLADKARKFRDMHHSKNKRFVHDGVGFNYRMTNLQAALGVGELKSIKEYIRKKREIASFYKQLLKDVPGIIFQKTTSDTRNVCWMFAVRVDKKEFGMTRDALRKELAERGIETRDLFYSPNRQPVLKQYLRKTEIFPVAEEISLSGLYLPTGLALKQNQIKRVCKEIKDIYRKSTSK